MDKTSKFEYQNEVERYLEEKRVYDLFEEMMKVLIIKKPEDPLSFLVNYLKSPQSSNFKKEKLIFLVGPPGSNARENALEISNYLGFTCLSVGDLLLKEVSKKSQLGQAIENEIKNFKYVADGLVIETVFEQLKRLESDQNSLVLEGFPKTKAQAFALQKAGYIPSSFLLLNVNSEKTLRGCMFPSNIGEVKSLYNNNIFQVDAENSPNEVLEDMARLLQYKVKPHGPRRSLFFLVLGAPGSGRTSLSKELAKRYGLVYISTSQLILDEIARKSNYGQQVMNNFNNSDLLPDEIVWSLLVARIGKPDCKLHGMVIDGFPKTINQLQMLEEVKLVPNFVFVIEANDEICKRRLSSGSQSEKRLDRWKTFLRDVEQNYSHLIFKVDGNTSAINVLEKCTFHIENSL